MAASTTAWMPISGSVNQPFLRKPRPTASNSRLRPASRVFEPAPGHAGDDERDRQREHEDRAEDLLADVAIQQYRQQQPDQVAGDDEQDGEDERVPQVDLKALVLQQPTVVLQADEIDDR